MSFLLRLISILNVIAKYRLGEFLRGKPGASILQLCLLPFSLLWMLSTLRHQPKEVRLRLALQELGPIYIKLGQLLSTRRDFLEPELADELATLQDKVPPFKTPPIEDIIRAELNVDPSSVFASFEEQPFASASVAQVYAATLHNGDDVVIKVVRPGIEKTVKSDIRVLKWLAALVENRTSIGRRLRPIEIINDYESVIIGELNLQSEAANTSELKRNFANSPALYVPRVYWDYVSRNMMVVEKINGIPVTEMASLASHNINLKALAETGVNIFFTQVFEHNFFHADMHPGNIFVAKHSPEQPQYIAIDCAIIGSLTDSDQDYLAKNLLAMLKRDYRRVAELHVASGWVPADTKVHEFESAIRSVCEPIFEKPLKEISFADLLLELFRTAGKFNMEVQPSLVLLQKTLLNIEGLGRQLYPDLDLWETALPFLERWQAKRLSPVTLFNRIRDNLPELLENLPQLPHLLAEAAAQQKQLSTINQNLKADLAHREQRELKAQRQAKIAGMVLLGLTLGCLLSPVNDWLENTSMISLGLGLSAVYFLCFKR
ncbi:MAG: ubiquinone biosynthesis regulatory protein kinase UbiB [Pseudohongiellaceae bacterium]